MSRVKNVRNGISMGLINNALTIIFPFISRTIIIRQLGTEYVGLGSLFTSILQVLSLSELGFGSAIGYLLYRPLAENNRTKVNAILRFYRHVYFIIGTVILILSVCLAPFLDKLIAGDIPVDINLYSLYIVYVFNTVISYFFGAYKKILLSANQRYDVDVSIASGMLIIQYIVQIVLLLLYQNYYIYVIVVPVMTLFRNLVSLYYVNKLFPGYSCEGSLSKAEVIEIMKNTGGAFFSKIGSTVYLSADNIVISAFLGLSVLGLYNNYYYVISSLIAVFAVVHNSVRPVIGNVLVTECNEKSWSIFKKINYLYMLAVIVCCSCCFVLFQSFECVWAGKDNMLDSSIAILLVIYFFSGRVNSLMSVFLEAAGIFWQGKFIPLASSLVNLGINIVLVQAIGLKGVVLSSIIGSVCISFPGYAHILFKYLFKEQDKKKQYMKEVAKLLICLAIDAAVCWLIVGRITVDGWGALILKGFLAFSVASATLVSLNIRNQYLQELLLKMTWTIGHKLLGKSKKSGGE